MEELLINQYLRKNGITINGKYFSSDKSTDRKEIISQIELIVELHKTLIGCKFEDVSRIRSTIGKEVEAYKVQIQKLQRHYDYIVSKVCANEVEKLILSEGKLMLKQAKKALNYIYEHDYFGVIRRSMNREEICIGRIDKSNLRKVHEEFQIGTLKGMSYNLVEEDLYNYIKKLQRREIDIDEEELIKAFVYKSHLSFNSLDYLNGLCSYPKDFLRTWERYKERKGDNICFDSKAMEHKDDKRKKTDEEVLLELKRSLKYESKSFIKI
ncbi:spore coat protein [Clostridium sp.]|uniref:spore coat protein n=1 Tax=Clostridium sp. TaxID=1506 RepID=UPI002842C990|nr:spore coat protein [Clostridium sp.]MDR3595686.1 spore coat protein [Clostridium sp.]